MLTLLVYFVIAVIVLGFAWYVVLPAVPDEFKPMAKIIIGLIAVVAICYLLLGLVGGAPPLHLSR